MANLNLCQFIGKLAEIAGEYAQNEYVLRVLPKTRQPGQRPVMSGTAGEISQRMEETTCSTH